MTLIAVQDILINFKYFSSQDILIRDRTFFYFGKIWRNLINSKGNTFRKGEKHKKRTNMTQMLAKMFDQDNYSVQDIY